MWYGLDVLIKYVKSVVWTLKCDGTFGGQSTLPCHVRLKYIKYLPDYEQICVRW